MAPFVPAALVVTLAFNPYAVGGVASSRSAVAELGAPAEDSQPGWDEIEAEGKKEETKADEAATTATATPTPAPTPKPSANAKPTYRKGTGLIIGASITGGLGWVLGLTRMAFVKKCADAIQAADNAEKGFGAASTCFTKAGLGNLLLLPFQYTLNAATWGLAPAAGAVRGRYDGVEHAWSGKRSRKAGAFIGVGAGVLALGVIGRIVAAAMVGAPFKKLSSDALLADPEGAVEDFSRAYRLRLFGVQLSSASIALGAGLLAFGAAYRKNYESQSKFLQQVRIMPDVQIDPRVGLGSAGLAISGRF
ncbi:MAG: hypothetical protein K1X88_14085 [Nannocystaceae bacterium]|nr:hypothetical protein [Nannocystaceae bacterium]